MLTLKIICFIVLYCIVFIHFYSASHSLSLSEAPRPQQLTLCRSLHAKALQAIAGKGLAQGPYMAARAGFEPTTLRSNRVVSTNAPPCPTNTIVSVYHFVRSPLYPLPSLLPQSFRPVFPVS